MVQSASALDLEAMLPTQVGAASLVSVTRDLTPVWDRTETIDTTPPVITNVNAAAFGDGTALITWDTNEAADSRVDFGTDPGALNTSVTDAVLVTGHSLQLSSLAPNTTIYYRVIMRRLSGDWQARLTRRWHRSFAGWARFA